MPTKDSRRSTTSPTSSPTAACWRAGCRPGPSVRGRADSAGGVPVSPLRERPVRRCAHPPARGGTRRRAVGRVAAYRGSAFAVEGCARLHGARAGDRRAIADRLRRLGDFGRRHDESGGGRARHACVHHFRGSSGCRRRAPDRRRPSAQARQTRPSCELDKRDRVRAAPDRVSPRSGAAWSSCCSRPHQLIPASPRIRPMRRRISSPALSSHTGTRYRGWRSTVRLSRSPIGWLRAALRQRPDGHATTKLLERTVWWVLGGSLVVLLLSRVYQRRWRYSGQRDYEAVAARGARDRAAHRGGDDGAPPRADPHLLAHPGKPWSAATADNRWSCPTA